MEKTPTPNSGKQVPPNPSEEIKTGAQSLWSGIKKFWFNLIDLQAGLDREGTIINIRNNMRMQGANAWTLMCSIMIASLGLNLNSPAVIIGAMLISPLMSPILGVGLSVGINDFTSLRISFKHFGISIAIALITSTLYFLFTPLGELTSEMVGRTAPTIFDAAVAFFGGIAGIISGSQKDKSNAIPGVAIATALMPPLCVTGFGIADYLKNGIVNSSYGNLTTLNNLEIILNSFYLFFLNATIVAIATFLIVRLVHFPMRKFSSRDEKLKTNSIIALVSIAILIPSFFILTKVLRQTSTENLVREQLSTTFGDEYRYVDSYHLMHTDTSNICEIKVYQPGLSNSLSYYQDILNNAMPSVTIRLLPTSEVSKENFEIVAKQAAKVDEIERKYQELINKKNEQDLNIVNELRESLRGMTQDTSLMQNVGEEVLATFGDFVKAAIYFHPSPYSPFPPTLVLDWKDEESIPIGHRIEKMVKARAKIDKLVVAKQ